MGVALPGRNTVLWSSIVFTAASILLLLQFTTLHYNWPFGGGPISSAWAHEVDVLGALSCIGWFVGFSLLIDWIVFDTFPVWGASRRALIGATLKLIASAFFCVEPFSDLTGYLQSVKVIGGVPWSNFVGILFFHCGNVIDAVGMFPMINWSDLFSLGNTPPIAMIVYMSATWFLVFANGIAYLSTPAPGGPEVNVGSASNFVAPGHVTGACLLTVGSLMYTAWSYVLGRHSVEPEPLLSITPIGVP